MVFLNHFPNVCWNWVGCFIEVEVNVNERSEPGGTWRGDQGKVDYGKCASSAIEVELHVNERSGHGGTWGGTERP